MRLATSLLALLLSAALLAGCDSVPPLKPDPTGDATFVTKLKQLCAEAPALKPVNSSQDAATIIANATANRTAVQAVQQGILKLTPSLSAGTPLGQPITDLAAMLLDVIYRYTTPIQAVEAKQPKTLTKTAEAKQRKTLAKTVDYYAGLRHRDLARAQADLAKLGISTCFA